MNVASNNGQDASVSGSTSGLRDPLLDSNSNVISPSVSTAATEPSTILYDLRLEICLYANDEQADRPHRLFIHTHVKPKPSILAQSQIVQGPISVVKIHAQAPLFGVIKTSAGMIHTAKELLGEEEGSIRRKVVGFFGDHPNYEPSHVGEVNMDSVSMMILTKVGGDERPLDLSTTASNIIFQNAIVGIHREFIQFGSDGSWSPSAMSAFQDVKSSLNIDPTFVPSLDLNPNANAPPPLPKLGPDIKDDTLKAKPLFVKGHACYLRPDPHHMAIDNEAELISMITTLDPN
ncbi:hypothetical protein HDU76_012056, partial [Blyttiomyces sp. JEL0837]